MPAPRCRFFDESGSPVNGGCLRMGRGCPLVHPGDPRWDTSTSNNAPTAPRSLRLDQPRAGGGGRNASGGGGWGGGNRGSSTVVSGWGAPQPNSAEKPTESSWDTSDWGAPTTGANRVQRSSFGGFGGGGGGGGGGGDTENGAWGAPPSGNAWGDPPSGEQADGRSSNAAWGAPSKEPDQPRVPSGGADRTKVAKSEGKGKAPAIKTDSNHESTSRSQFAGPHSPKSPTKEKAPAVSWGLDNGSVEPVWTASIVPTPQPPPPRSAGSDGGGGRKPAPVAAPPPSTTDNDSTAVPQPARTSGPPKPLNGTAKHDAQIESPLSSTREDVVMADWTEVSQSNANARPSGSGAASPSGTEQTSSTARAQARQGVQTETEKLTRMAMGLVAKAARIEGEMHTAESDRNRMKKIQNSDYYSHVGHAGRKKLEEGRLQAEEKLGILKAEHSNLVKLLIKSEPASRVSVEMTAEIAEDIKRYTDEIKEWITDIRGTLLALTTHPPPTAVEQPQAAALPDQEEPHATTPGIESADEPRARLASTILDLEARMERIQGDFLLSSYTTLTDTLDEKIDRRLQSMKLTPSEEGECTPDPVIPPEHIVATEKIETLSGEVRELASNNKSLRTDFDKRDDEFRRMKAEHEVMKQQRDAMLDKLAQYEKRHREDSEHLELLKQQASQLEEYARTAQASRQEEAVQAENLVREMESLVKEVVQRYVPSLLAEMNESYTRELARCKEEIFENFLTQLQQPISISEAFALLLQAMSSR